MRDLNILLHSHSSICVKNFHNIKTPEKQKTRNRLLILNISALSCVKTFLFSLLHTERRINRNT